MLFGIDRAIISNWRFEYKYRLSVPKYRQLRAALMPYVEPDDYTALSEDGTYYVRSLYFDTADYRAYHEKMGGDYGRTKLRIRTYDKEYREDSILKVELKTRRGTPMEKFSAIVTPADYRNYQVSRHWADEENPVLCEFARLVYLRELRPNLLVEYERVGLTPRDRESVRLTFDLGVRSASASEVFPQRPFWRDHHRNEVVFEIKCQKKLPRWLSDIVRSHGIKPVANSKYTRAVEVCRPDVVYMG